MGGSDLGGWIGEARNLPRLGARAVRVALIVASALAVLVVTDASAVAHKHAAKPTGWERLLNKAGAERRVTKATALDAFALAMGPIPGIHVSHNDVGVVDSGDDAVDWILPYMVT